MAGAGAGDIIKGDGVNRLEVEGRDDSDAMR